MTLKLSDLKRLKKQPWQRSKAKTVRQNGRTALKLTPKQFARLTGK